MFKIPGDSRLRFLVSQFADLQGWRTIPLDLGLASAPLYEHSALPVQLIVIATILVLSIVWERRTQFWIRARFGVFEPLSGKAILSWTASCHLAFWSCLAAAILFTSLWHAGLPLTRPHGWMDQILPAWQIGGICLCTKRVFDQTNLLSRRVRNAFAALIFLLLMPQREHIRSPMLKCLSFWVPVISC